MTDATSNKKFVSGFANIQSAACDPQQTTDLSMIHTRLISSNQRAGAIAERLVNTKSRLYVPEPTVTGTGEEVMSQGLIAQLNDEIDILEKTLDFMEGKMGELETIA